MSTLLRFLLGFVIGVVAFVAIASLPFWPRASATHQFVPPQRLVALCGSEGGAAWYSLCAGGDPTTALIWAYGPEIWEVSVQPPPFADALHFHLSAIECNTDEYISVIFQWEYAQVCADPDAIACHKLLDWVWHDGHWDIPQSTIVYDYARYMDLLNHDWRGVVSAHEWGHAMSLDDHGELMNCPDDELIMAGILNDDRPVPCVLAPHFLELCSTMNAYGYDPDADCLRNAREALVGTDPNNPDSDDDGCADSEEVAGVPAPKPGATGAYDPLAWYDFYDVPVPANPDPDPNGPRDGAITMGDVLATLSYVGACENCPPNPNGVDYDSLKDGDWNGDTVVDAGDKVGLRYDRSPSSLPDPPWQAGPPTGAVTLGNVLVLLNQVGLDCSGPPPPGGGGDGGASGGDDGISSSAPNAMAVDATPRGGIDSGRTVKGLDPFDIDVVINAAEKPYGGYQFSLSYDDRVLALVPTADLDADTALESWTYKSIGGDTLEPTVFHLDLDGDTALDTAMGGSVLISGTTSATGGVATLRFQCVGEGSSPIHLVGLSEAAMGATTLAVGGAAIETALSDAEVRCSGVE